MDVYSNIHVFYILLEDLLDVFKNVLHDWSSWNEQIETKN